MPVPVKNVSLLIFSIANAGGCERITCGLANELSRRGYNVSIIHIYNEHSSFFPLDDKVKLKKLYKKKTIPSKYHFPFVPFRLLKLLQKKADRPDVLIGVGTDMVLYALPAIRFFKIPFISWEHFNFTVGTHEPLTVLGRKLSAKWAEYIIVLTQKDQSLFQTHLPISGRVACLPNFMSFTPGEPSLLNSKMAIAVGRYTHQKGFDNLIKIWEKITVHHPDWQLKIIGKGEDQPLLETLISEKNLSNTVHLEMVSHNVALYYQQASLFLLSSRWEGLPMVTIEAKSFGLPIIGFDCETGPRDVIKNNEDGILVEDQNIEAFATAVNKLLDDRQLLKKMGAKALLNSKDFTPEVIIPLWEDLFSQITKRK